MHDLAIVEPPQDEGKEVVDALVNYTLGIEELEKTLLAKIESEQIEAAECPVRHTFPHGLYVRTVRMPAGAVVIGAEHKESTLNIFHSGRMQVMINGQITEISEPRMFVSDAGIRKVALILEDVEFSNVHPNPDNCTDVDELERRFVIQPNAPERKMNVIL